MNIPFNGYKYGLLSISLTRAWQGYFHNLTGKGGLFFAPTPQNLGTTARIYKMQSVFDRSVEFVEGNLMLFTSGSQVRSKSKCLTIWSSWFCRALDSYEMETSQYNDMDRVWNTSKYHPKPSGSIFKVKVIQGHEVKGRSNGKFGIWAVGYLFLGQISSRTRKNDPRTLFERSKSDNVWKSREWRNRRKRREKWHFSTYKTPKLGHFLRYPLEILYTCTPERFLSYIFLFWKFEKISIFWK